MQDTQQDIQRQLPAHQALLWACATSFDGGNEATAQPAIERALNAAPIDWPACARESIRHGVAPLMAHRLVTCSNPGSVPDNVRACFARMLHANGLRNQVMFRVCARLLRGLEAAGIRTLILKGVGLALTVYPQPALRNFADIDLMVVPADLDAASAVARGLGFVPAHGEADSCLLHRTFAVWCPEDILTETLPLEFETDLSHDIIAPHRHHVVVEIHQGIFRDVSGIARRVDNAPLWQSPQEVRLPDGTASLLPSPEVMLIHLCDHAAGHGYARLMFFVDLALVLKHYGPTFDWDRVIDLAVRYESGERVARCLDFVQREFGVSIPPRVLHALACASGLRRVRPLRPADVFEGEREHGPGIVLQGLLQAQNPRQFAIALRHILAPPPVLMRRYYRNQHPLALPALYLWRPILLSGHLMQALLRRARQRHTG